MIELDFVVFSSSICLDQFAVVILA